MLYLSDADVAPLASDYAEQALTLIKDRAMIQPWMYRLISPAQVSAEPPFDLAVSGLSFGCMYAMMAVGLTLVYGLLRILHIAHAAVFALGAYITVIVANLGDGQ